jgi:hypothetical protein
MLNSFNPAKFVRPFTTKKGDSGLSFQARAIARWDNEGGAPNASDQHNSPNGEEHRRRASTADGEPDMSLMRKASPASNSRELRALDDLYHQSFWRV